MRSVASCSQTLSDTARSRRHSQQPYARRIAQRKHAGLSFTPALTTLSDITASLRATGTRVLMPNPHRKGTKAQISQPHAALRKDICERFAAPASGPPIPVQTPGLLRRWARQIRRPGRRCTCACFCRFVGRMPSLTAFPFSTSAVTARNKSILTTSQLRSVAQQCRRMSICWHESELEARTSAGGLD